MKSNQVLTHPSVLARNTVFNLIGYGAPLIVAVFTIPHIIAGLGTDRFGVLTLAWVLIGYLGLLDLGLGRALTAVVAEKLGAGQAAEIPATIWTGLSAMSMVAVVLVAVGWLTANWVVFQVLNIPEGLVAEAYGAYRILVLFVPAVIVSVGLRGILEAYQRFDLVNSVRIPLGVLSFGAPVVVIFFTVDLRVVILVLCTVRVAAAGVQFYFCRQIVSGLTRNYRIETEKLFRLMRFGGWMTVTNVIGPALVYVDRFFIGALLSLTAVTFYATPSEVITKLTLVSGALMSVLFPAISSSYRVDRKQSAFLLERGSTYIFLCMFPIVLLMVTFVPEGLAIWLDSRFVENSTPAARILSVGVFFICWGQIPYAFIQGAGRPDWTGVLHLCQLPLYLVSLMVFTTRGGIAGVALIWTIRAIADTLVMFVMARRLIGPGHLHLGAKTGAGLAAVAAFAGLSNVASLPLRMVGFTLIVAVFSWWGFRFGLSGGEKALMGRLSRGFNKD